MTTSRAGSQSAWACNFERAEPASILLKRQYDLRSSSPNANTVVAASTEETLKALRVHNARNMQSRQLSHHLSGCKTYSQARKLVVNVETIGHAGTVHGDVAWALEDAAATAEI
ncbi:hypothetical protein BGW80DRAFT_1248818 [Lactifluus volemus]|nr:hypothetical protein BGW80DRAFT_1248818 [Lactifluus volemus]